MDSTPIDLVVTCAKSTSAPCWFDPGRRLLVCGDRLSSPRIESALTSGVAAAEMLLAAR